MITIGMIKPDKRITHHISLNGFKTIHLEQFRPSSLFCGAIFISDDLLKQGIEIYDPITISDYLFSALIQYIPSMIRKKKGYILFMSDGYMKIGVFEKLVMSKIRLLYNVQKIRKKSNLPYSLSKLFNVLDEFISIYEPYRTIADDVILTIYEIK